MSRIENVIFASTSFSKGQANIEQAFENHDTVHLHAEADAIQTAIALAQHYVRVEQMAIYEKFQSNLVINQQGQTVPKCSIILRYNPILKDESNNITQKPKYVAKEKEKGERKDRNYSKKNQGKDNDKHRKVYRDREERSGDWSEQYDRRRR